MREGPVTRQSGDRENFKIPAARLDVRKNSFAVRTVQHWNELLAKIISAKDCQSYKRELKRHRESGGRPQV
jgi:hypothetical protein